MPANKGDRLQGMLSKSARQEADLEREGDIARQQDSTPARIEQVTPERFHAVTQARNTESVQDVQQDKKQERQRYIPKERPKSNMIEGNDGIWREKSGYAFDPARISRLKRIAFELEQETGEKWPLYRLIEEGMDYIIARYVQYERR